MTWHPVESVIPKEHEQRALLMDQYGHIVIGVWQPAGVLSTKGGPWLVEGEPTIAAGARFDRWQPFPKITTTKTINNLISALEHEITKTIEVAVNDERNRCAAIADSMDGIQNIGDRIRYGLGNSGPKEKP